MRIHQIRSEINLVHRRWAALRFLWTGSKLLVVASGGGAALDPATDEWTSLATAGAPVLDLDGVAGSLAAAYGEGKLYVFGSFAAQGTTSSLRGGIYDFATSTWAVVDMAGAPLAGRYQEAVWTEVGVLVWANGLSFYHFGEDLWRPADAGTSYGYEGADGGAAGFDAHLLVDQTGVTVEVYSSVPGAECCSLPTDDARFDLASRTWSSRSRSILPRRLTPPVPVGDRYRLVYSGAEPASMRSDKVKKSVVKFAKGGWLWDDREDRLLLLPATPSTPSPRGGAAVVMAGDRLFVWGGCEMEYNDGTCAQRTRTGKLGRLILP